VGSLRSLGPLSRNLEIEVPGPAAPLWIIGNKLEAAATRFAAFVKVLLAVHRSPIHVPNDLSVRLKPQAQAWIAKVLAGCLGLRTKLDHQELVSGKLIDEDIDDVFNLIGVELDEIADCLARAFKGEEHHIDDVFQGLMHGSWGLPPVNGASSLVMILMGVSHRFEVRIESCHVRHDLDLEDAKICRVAIKHWSVVLGRIEMTESVRIRSTICRSGGP
jgi:hypothetical protein